MVRWPSFLQRDTELTAQSEFTVGELTARLTECSCNVPLDSLMPNFQHYIMYVMFQHNVLCALTCFNRCFMQHYKTTNVREQTFSSSAAVISPVIIHVETSVSSRAEYTATRKQTLYQSSLRLITARIYHQNTASVYLVFCLNLSFKLTF